MDEIITEKLSDSDWTEKLRNASKSGHKMLAVEKVAIWLSMKTQQTHSMENATVCGIKIIH